MMRAIKVLCHIEHPCDKCGGTATTVGLARVMDDGRIDEVVYEGKEQLRHCRNCEQAERNQERAAHKKTTQQRMWTKGQMGKLVK